jgi:hypothetical protein
VTPEVAPASIRLAPTLWRSLCCLKLHRWIAVRCTFVVSLSSILIATISSANAETVVSFIHPERFTDASLNGGFGPESEQPALTGIARYLESLGGRYLGSHQSLVIEVTNVDLAGQFEPWRKLAYDVRVMRDIYPPRIALRYKLTEEGQLMAEGEAKIVDINYLANPSVRLVQDPLRYEKAMLSDWFRISLFARRPASSGL